MARRKWITKAEINTILKTYSIQKNEFEEITEFEEVTEYYYQSRFVKGYVIHISKEFQEFEKLGRIQVFHSCQKGRRTFCDIWERDKEGRLYFKFRNPAQIPLSDVYYIRQLEEHIEAMKKAGRKLQEELSVLKNKENNNRQEQ